MAKQQNKGFRIRQLFSGAKPLTDRAKILAERLKPAAPWIGGVAGIVLIPLLGWFLLTQLPQRNVPPVVSEAEKRRADVINSNRGNVLTVVQTVAGLGFIATAYLAWRNSQLAEDKNVTDRFSRAVEMLADEKLEMRLGGIYSLERIARDSKEDHPVVMEVLTAFVRDRAGKPEDVQHGSFVSSFIAQQSQGAGEKAERKPSQAIQSALTVIGRRNIKDDQQRINLAGTNLQGAHLEEAHLEGATLWGAHLDGAILWGAHLERATLGRAHLEGANLWEAHLEEADLEEAHLDGATLGRAHLEGAALGGAHLEWAKLMNTHLEGANLWEAHLEWANLWEAHLEEADLEEAHLERATLGRAHLEGANLGRAHLEGANLRNAHLERANLRNAHLDGADLFDAHLEGANLRNAHLEGANLGHAHLEGADLFDAHLEGADLGGAHLEGADLGRAHLEGANLGYAHLDGADLRGAHLDGAKLRNAHLDGAKLMNTHLEGANLWEAHLEEVQNLTQSQLTQAKLCRTALPDYITLDPNRDCEELRIDPETGKQIGRR